MAKQAPIVVNTHDAKTRLSQLLEDVEQGADVVIARAGRPVARLVPFIPPRPPRKPGAMKGRIRIAGDFDAPLPDEVLREFEGRD
jgi:prevent-host-death family protein